MSPVAAAADVVPERHYTHHEGRGETVNRSNPAVIHRELDTLDVGLGMRVAEFGTGSGYSGGLLSALVGETGQVTSLDIDAYLTRWANLIHAERGLTNIRCVTGDGTAGHAEHAPYDRMVAWCTPPLLPAAWVDQVVDGGVIVAPLPIAAIPNLTVVAKIRVTGGRPGGVEAVFNGGYIEATASPKTHLDVPGRWMDWENRVPAPSWISIGWRADDDWRHTGARATLDRLLRPGHTEHHGGDAIDWASWRTWAAAFGDTSLTMAGLPDDVLALGHSTADSAAVLREDGTILADSPDSPSLATLRKRLTDWEDAGRPAPHTYRPHLAAATSTASPAGWDLTLSR